MKQRSRKAKPKPLGVTGQGWIGIVDDRPHWQETRDDYTRGEGVMMLTVYPNRREIAKRYECYRLITWTTARERGVSAKGRGAKRRKEK